MYTATHIAYVGLGANLGNPQQTIQAAIYELGKVAATNLTKTSSLYLSAPVNADGDDYINAVIELHTQLSPSQLHAELQKIEHQFARTRHYKNAPRTLDLDLLLYDQCVISTANLQIPHPRMTQRAFVLLPLIEIDPEAIIPNIGPAKNLLAGVQSQLIRKV